MLAANIGVKFHGCDTNLVRDRTKIKQIGNMWCLFFLIVSLINNIYHTIIIIKNNYLERSPYS